MNNEQIESAATEYIHCDKTHGLTRKKAFTDGARWVLETLCEMPLDELLRELAEYANERIGGAPGADHMANRMMRDSLGTGLSKSAVWHTDPKEAQTRRKLIVQFKIGNTGMFDDIRLLRGMENMVARYAYVDDILPADAPTPPDSGELGGKGGAR